MFVSTFTNQNRKFVYGCVETYRYGFNKMEKDDEIKGNGNSYDFGARIYDSRLGRWLSLDPMASKYPSLSPYVAFANNPNYYIDPGGETLRVAGSSKENIESAQKDILSLLPPGKAGFKFSSKLEFMKDGTVAFKITEKQAKMSGDAGVQLLYNLVNNRAKFQYSTDKVASVMVNDEPGSIQEKEGITNAPSRNKYAASSILAKKSPISKEIDALVNIPSNLSVINSDGSKERRASTVFHELQEVYSIQAEGILYFSNTTRHSKEKGGWAGNSTDYPNEGAHDKSIRIAKDNFKEGDHRYDKDPGEGEKTTVKE